MRYSSRTTYQLGAGVYDTRFFARGEVKIYAGKGETDMNQTHIR